MRSKVSPKILIELVEDYGNNHFIGILKGHRILCHKDCWEKVGE